MKTALQNMNPMKDQDRWESSAPGFAPSDWIVGSNPCVVE